MNNSNFKNGSGIYKFINIINNKVYVGSAFNLKNRRRQHLFSLRHNKHCNEHLQSAWNKYGEENFIFEVIEYVDDKTMLLNVEEFYILLYDANNREFGYNKREISDSNKGMKHTDEAKQKMSDAHKKENLSEQSRKNMSDGGKGKIISDDCKRKISEGNSGKHRSKEDCDKISNGKMGKKISGNWTSRYCGVCFNTRKNKWNATIRYNRKNFYIGSYFNEIDAALAYNAKALELYGENAKLNIIEEEDKNE
jgi:group I intron endonuclease